MTQPPSEPIILMYHGIIKDEASVPPDREPGAELYDVSLQDFREQMSWLKDNGHNVTVLPIGENVTDKRQVILTFDDGEKNNFDLALPVLRELGFRAYFFIIAKRVGKSGYMNMDNLKSLIKQGMAVGSHGLSHEILTHLLDTQTKEELSASKRYLEVNLGCPVNSLSIPRGFCNDKILKMAYDDIGYENIFISDRPNGVKTPALSRTAVKGEWNMKRFQMAIEGKVPAGEVVFDRIKNAVKKVLGGTAYDWIRRLMLKVK